MGNLLNLRTCIKVIFKLSSTPWYVVILFTVTELADTKLHLSKHSRIFQNKSTGIFRHYYNYFEIFCQMRFRMVSEV